MKKFFKKFSSTVLASVMTASLLVASASCADGCGGGTTFSAYDANGGLVFSSQKTEITVEYGDAYKIPVNFAVNGEKKTLTSWKLLDASGNEIKTQYGTYTFKVMGSYTVEYVCEGKTFRATIVCRDTVAPELTVYEYDRFGSFGDVMTLPNASASDLSGVEKIKYKVTAPDGTTTEYEDENATYTLEKVGTYTVTIIATDKNGVKTERQVSILSLEKFIDEAKKENELYSFNNDDYLSLVVGMENRLSSAEYSIVKSGYPAIENDTDENGVLQIKGDSVWGNVNTQFLNHEGVKANVGHEIVIRYAVSAPTDYIKIFKSPSKMSDSGLVAQVFGDKIQPNVWQELRINPIAFGYNLDFTDFVLQFRNKGDVTMYIDSISFTQPEFTDEDWSDTNLGDFDEAGYLEHVYQNVYCDPTTTRSFRIDGTEFEVLPAGDSRIPAANTDGNLKGEGAHGGVLKVVPTASFGGMTYMFPDRVDLDETQYIRMRVYYEGSINAFILGFFDGKGYDSTNTHWFDNSHYCFNSKKWCDLYFSAEDLRKFSTDGGIYGFYIQTTLTGGIDHNYQLTFYLDEIEAVKKTATSEQVKTPTGMNIATFEQNSTANLTQTISTNQSAYAIFENVMGKDGKSLKVEAPTGGGVKYFLDENLFADAEANKTLAFKFKAFIPEDSKLTNLGLTFGTSFTTFKSVQTWKITDDMKGQWIEFAVSGKAINEAMSSKAVSTISFVATTEDGSKQTFYLDDLRIFSYAGDTTAPGFDELTAQTSGVWKGEKLDATKLNLPITDDMDVAPYYEVVSVKDPDGVSVNHENGVFTPLKSGAYTLTIRACDAIGNKSAEKDLILKVQADEFKTKKSGTSNEYVLADFSRYAPQSMLSTTLRWDYELNFSDLPRVNYSFDGDGVSFIGMNWGNSYVRYNFHKSISSNEFMNGQVAVRYSYNSNLHNNDYFIYVSIIDSNGKSYYPKTLKNHTAENGVAIFEYSIPENLEVKALWISASKEKVDCKIYEITLKTAEVEKGGVGVSFGDTWN